MWWLTIAPLPVLAGRMPTCANRTCPSSWEEGARIPACAGPTYLPRYQPPSMHMCLTHRKVPIPARVPPRYPGEQCRNQTCPPSPVFPELSYICRQTLNSPTHSGLFTLSSRTLYEHTVPASMAMKLHSVARLRSPAQPARCGMCTLSGSCGPRCCKKYIYSVTIQWGHKGTAEP